MKGKHHPVQWCLRGGTPQEGDLHPCSRTRPWSLKEGRPQCTPLPATLQLPSCPGCPPAALPRCHGPAMETSPGVALPAAKCIGEVGGQHRGALPEPPGVAAVALSGGSAPGGGGWRVCPARCQLSREIRTNTSLAEPLGRVQSPSPPGEVSGGRGTDTREGGRGQNTGQMPSVCPPLPFLGVTAFAPHSLLSPPLCPRCPLSPCSHHPRRGGTDPCPTAPGKEGQTQGQTRRQTQGPKPAVARSRWVPGGVLAPTTAPRGAGGDLGHPGCTQGRSRPGAGARLPGGGRLLWGRCPRPGEGWQLC